MTPEFRLRELEEERTRLLEQIEQQKTVVVFLAKCFGKALSERDKARDLCVAMEAEADVYGVSLLGPAGYEPATSLPGWAPKRPRGLL